jgi:hypothetical protein
MLPAHIMVDRCTTVAEAMARCQDDKHISVEVFLVCIQLYYQISAFHIRKKVIRDLCQKNVVQTLTGNLRRWTLLEYCSTVASGTDSSHVPLHMTTPEVCLHGPAGSSSSQKYQMYGTRSATDVACSWLLSVSRWPPRVLYSPHP